jgi:hypothetical protein
MDRRHNPGAPEDRLLPVAFAREVTGQQAIRDEHGEGGDDHAGDRGDGQGVNQAGPLVAGPGVLLPALLDEENEPMIISMAGTKKAD